MISITKIIKSLISNKQNIAEEEAKKRNVVVNNIILQIKSLSNSNQIALTISEGGYIMSTFDL